MVLPRRSARVRLLEWSVTIINPEKYLRPSRASAAGRCKDRPRRCGAHRREFPRTLVMQGSAAVSQPRKRSERKRSPRCLALPATGLEPNPPGQATGLDHTAGQRAERALIISSGQRTFAGVQSCSLGPVHPRLKPWTPSGKWPEQCRPLTARSLVRTADPTGASPQGPLCVLLSTSRGRGPSHPSRPRHPSSSRPAGSSPRPPGCRC